MGARVDADHRGTGECQAHQQSVYLCALEGGRKPMWQRVARGGRKPICGSELREAGARPHMGARALEEKPYTCVTVGGEETHSDCGHRPSA